MLSCFGVIMEDAMNVVEDLDFTVKLEDLTEETEFSLELPVTVRLVYGCVLNPKVMLRIYQRH